jgi:hypothetical protein
LKWDVEGIDGHWKGLPVALRWHQEGMEKASKRHGEGIMKA